MDIKFRDWVVGRIEEETGNNKQAFLRTLKTQPELAADFIRGKLRDWMVRYTVETGKSAVILGVGGAGKELADYFGQYFSKELEAIK